MCDLLAVDELFGQLSECLRKSTGDIRDDLIQLLRVPGKGKPLKVVAQEVEEELSKNLEFSVQKVGKTCWLHCRKEKVALPSDKSWKLKVFKESKTEIPYVTAGKHSVRCVKFFQEKEGEDLEMCSDVGRDGSNSIRAAGAPLPGSGTPSSHSGGEGQVLLTQRTLNLVSIGNASSLTTQEFKS